ncbi:Annexin D8 [Citrus sinensis]|uniref:Annexin D8 n=1 Tax=Citrus sinensis TaxID=2711 RepID=A0ACB8LM09_CITSI|nr:Annexin D8 [Citrus sinensis]
MATLVAPVQHSHIEDAKALYKACKGWGTDEKAVISILGHRTAAQRQQIRLAYQNLYQEDLVKRLESELSGAFEKAVYRWILEPADRDAVLANVAIKKACPDYHVIIEIACVHSPEELLAVRRAYQLSYKLSLEEDVAAHTTGDLRKLLVALVSVLRYDGPEINARLAKSEADILEDAIKNKAFNHEEVIRILTTRSKAQLMATFNRYRDDCGTSITKIIRNAIKGAGTDEDALTRVIVTRAEKDLKVIKEVYYKRNSVTLEQAVAKDTSGDYNAFLLTLLGKAD